MIPPLLARISTVSIGPSDRRVGELLLTPTLEAVDQTLDRYSFAVFVPLALVAVVVGMIVARRTGRPLALVVLTGFALAGIVALTLGGRMVKLSAWRYRGVHLDWIIDGGLWRNAVRIDRGSLRNIALFVPAGALLTATTRRAGASILVLAAMSLLIEVAQSTWGLGAADVSDILANILGASIGAGIAALAMPGRREPLAS